MAIDASLYEDEEKEYDYNKILENCNFDFSSEIMTRGNKYYVDGNVLQCFKVNDGFIAKVKGSADKIYTVHINIYPLDEYVEYECDCPYEDNCKHEYATLIAINYGDYEIANLKPEITEKSESILNIIKSVPAEEIKEYLLTSNDKDLINSISFHDYFRKYFPIQEYNFYYNNLYNALILSTNYKNILDDYLNRVNQYISSKEFSEAYKILKAIIEAYNESKKLNYNEEVVELLSKLGMFLRVVKRKGDNTLKQEITTWANNLKYDNYYLEDILLSINAF